MRRSRGSLRRAGLCGTQIPFGVQRALWHSDAPHGVQRPFGVQSGVQSFAMCRELCGIQKPLTVCRGPLQHSDAPHGVQRSFAAFRSPSRCSEVLCGIQKPPHGGQGSFAAFRSPSRRAEAFAAFRSPSRHSEVLCGIQVLHRQTYTGFVCVSLSV